MVLHHRKLISESCVPLCHKTESCSSSDCFYFCLRNRSTSPNNNNNNNNNLPFPSDFHHPPSSPPLYSHQRYHHSTKSPKIPTFLIVTFTLLATTFLLLFCFVIYAVFFSRRSRSQHPTEEARDVFFSTLVDNTIWYIRTNSLQQSMIREIAVLKYKKGEGLVEGTECSVCLNEFEEDDNLRLLPKGNHAFHLSCIDTWLASQTNCPLCRAPIVTHSGRTPPSLEDSNLVNSSSMEDTQMDIPEDNGGNDGGIEIGASEMTRKRRKLEMLHIVGKR